MDLCRWLALLLLTTLVVHSPARPLAPQDVPEPLQPWIDWVLKADEQIVCPFAYNNVKQRRCAWPTALALQLDEKAGQFTASWHVYAPSWIVLPGNRKHWPQEVNANGKPALVMEHDKRPAIELEPGEYRIAGKFIWDQLPESFVIPADTGIVKLAVNGNSIDFPDVAANGQLWLKQRDTGAAARGGETDRLSVQVFRRIVDDNPMQIITQIDLEVAGDQREILLKGLMHEDVIPLSLVSRIPAQLEPDGRLRLQVRPGRWTVTATTRSVAERHDLPLPAREEPWAAEEVWVFDARNELRLVEVESVTSIDPRQTTLPQDWQQLPAFRLQAGDVMGFKVIRRGDPDPEPDKLNLSRNLWLDFDGKGYTISDNINGTMTQGWRLAASEALQLGRVILNGEPQFITTQTDSQNRGVEVRHGSIQLTADSRWESGIRSLPAVGWAHDFHSVNAILNLPPGWSLFSASGIDQVRDTWLQRWTLLDLFVVLIVALAIGHLWGPRWGLLALATLALIWHEPGAPRMVWLHILGSFALLRVLPEGKLQFVVRSYRNIALLTLIVITIPFLVQQVRTGIYPQLERPWQSVSPGRLSAVGGAVGDHIDTQNLMEEMDDFNLASDMAAAPEVSRAAPLAILSQSVSREGKRSRAYAARKLATIDPQANVQTGPGVPHWQWTQIPLNWNGPVERDQRMTLTLLSPLANLLLNGFRVALVMWLGTLILLQSRVLKPLDSTAATTAAFMLMVPLLALTPEQARADFPSPQMLEELRGRLTEPPECLPACAQIPRMRIAVEPTVLTLRLEVLAAEDVAIPLPGHAGHWLPTSVSIDGEDARNLFRQRKNTLWLLLRKGQHQVLLSGALPSRASLDLPLPLKPRHVQASAEGWRIDGLREDGQADNQLQLSRTLAGAAALELAELEPAPLPPFVVVERTLQLGLDWRMHTQVRRVSPAGTAVVIAVPLLTGESVTTPDIHVEDGKVQVNMASRTGSMAWESVLEKQAQIELNAADTTAWSEIWRADVSPIWHAEPAGIPVVHHQNPQGQWLPQWRPWPGESVSLVVTRPQGVAGQTLTIDNTNVHIQPGKRATDVNMNITLRSSQGGQHTISLPEDARLQTVTIDGTVQPVRQENRQVTLPLRPGAQNVLLSWRQPSGIAARFVSPAIDLGASSVNASINLSLGHDRWVLLTNGPTLGPAVLFWGVLIVIAAIAIGLGRIALTPLNSTAWLLLGIGLSQVNIWLAMLVVAWLLALGARTRLTDDTRKSTFNLAQIALGLLTVIALTILFQAIKQGLLGSPDMQIAGNGSSAYNLLWYQDRTSSAFPRATVWSAPLMVYRLLMLAWALWLAFALLRWLRWGWTCFAMNGIWRPFRVFKRGEQANAAQAP